MMGERKPLAGVVVGAPLILRRRRRPERAARTTGCARWSRSLLMARRKRARKREGESKKLLLDRLENGLSTQFFFIFFSQLSEFSLWGTRSSAVFSFESKSRRGVAAGVAASDSAASVAKERLARDASAGRGEAKERASARSACRSGFFRNPRSPIPSLSLSAHAFSLTLNHTSTDTKAGGGDN